jgi:hypothetical protein
MASNIIGAVAVAVASGRLNGRHRWLDQDEPRTLVHSAKKDAPLPLRKLPLNPAAAGVVSSELSRKLARPAVPRVQQRSRSSVSLMLWLVRPKKHPSYSPFRKAPDRACRSPHRGYRHGTSSIRSPVTAAPVAVLCARPLDNVSHARRDAHDFAFEALVSRIR